MRTSRRINLMPRPAASLAVVIPACAIGVSITVDNAFVLPRWATIRVPFPAGLVELFGAPSDWFQLPVAIAASANGLRSPGKGEYEEER